MPNVKELRQLIDGLATGVVMGESSLTNESGRTAAPILATLDAITTGARQGGYAGLARLAETLRQSADDYAGGGEGLSQALQDGVVGLQHACEQLETKDSSSSSLAGDPELLRDFILESREHLQSIENQALTLERDPLDIETLNAAFRSFHTIKGLAGFLELWDVQRMSHEVETLLDKARNNELRLTESSIDAVLESADYLRRWTDYLESWLAGNSVSAPSFDTVLMAKIQAAASGEDTLSIELDEPELEAAPAAVSAPESTGTATAAPTAEPAAAVTPPEPQTSHRKTETMTVKVDTVKLDYLVDMAGEMVIAQSLVQHDPDIAGVKTPRLQRNLAQLGRITAELQKTAMSMRLVPIGPLFRRMARLVRDLSRQFGKQVEMVTAGDDIDIDRTIVEELADPLMHMVRNALDHGIEMPADREQRGKPAVAHLRLSAQHQAGQVVIEISDDGRGLDRERILARAIERGVVAPGSEMSDTEIYNLIFEPGFSTAATVTSVSGRGVGMDVVRKHIQKLRGRIEIRTAAGKGSTFLLKLPLTLAIIDGLVVGVGAERYIIPLFAVREMFRPTADVVWTVKQKGEMALVRGSLLPVDRLYRRFHVKPRSENPLESILVVAETEGRRFCVMVDELIGKQEVVIKNLGEMFKHVNGVAGGAILGDGRVGLILDLDGLSREGTGDGGR